MHPFGKPPSSSGQLSSTNGNGAVKATSPITSTGQLSAGSTLGSRNGSATSSTTVSGGLGLRPSYGMMTDRERAEREMRAPERMTPEDRDRRNQRLSEVVSRSADVLPPRFLPHPPLASQTTPSPPTIAFPFNPTGSLPASAASTPREERPNPYGAPSQAASANISRKPDVGGSQAPRSATPLTSGLMQPSHSMFGYREQQQRADQAMRDRENERKERERQQRERERAALRAPHASTPASPTYQTANPANPYPRPSLPTSPTTARNHPSAAPASSGKPSVSPQIPPANATASNAADPSARPHLPLPGFSTLGSRSLPSPFDRDARERSNSATMKPAGQDASVGAAGHRRTPSGSSARGDTLPSLSAGGPTSPIKSTAQPGASSRSLYGGPPPPPLGQASRDRDPQRSPVARASTAASPREAASTVSSAASSKPPGSSGSAMGSAPSSASQTTRAPFNSYAGYGSGASYPGSFGGYGLGGFGGYGAFGPRWDQREEERKRREQREKEAAEARARTEQEKDVRWGLKPPGKDTPAASIAPVAPPAVTVATVVPSGDKFGDAAKRSQKAEASKPVARTTNRVSSDFAKYAKDTTGYPRYPEDETEEAGTQASFGNSQSGGATVPTAEGGSVMQQVAPSREPRPYGYKAEPRDYQYQPRDKRPRMDAAVEDAQTAHRKSSGAKASKRRKEEEKVKSPVVQAPKQRDWVALTKPQRRWPEVSSSPVEAWLKTVPDLNRIVSRQVYTGSEWTPARAGVTRPESEGGVVIVRIGGAFLGCGWKVRGEAGWDESLAEPRGDVVCGAMGRRKIWGSDVYTDDSDLGLILVHAGWIRWTPDILYGRTADNRAVERDRDIVNVTIRIVPRLLRYTSVERNGIKTRSWGNGHDGASIVVERVERVAIKVPPIPNSRKLEVRFNVAPLEIDEKIAPKSRHCKVRMGDWARQRSLVIPSLGKPPRIVTDWSDQAIMFAGGAYDQVERRLGPMAIAYKAYAWDGWLKPSLDQTHQNFWLFDLMFVTHDRELYFMSMCEPSTLTKPFFRLLHLSKKVRNDDGGVRYVDREILKAHSFDDVHIMEEGMAIRTEGDKGLLFRVKSFIWDPKDPVNPQETGMADEWDKILQELEKKDKRLLRQFKGQAYPAPELIAAAAPEESAATGTATGLQVKQEGLNSTANTSERRGPEAIVAAAAMVS
ncbi:hypothetical protein IAU60_001804 [Kwoniella sp. DSM 27419]